MKKIAIIAAMVFTTGLTAFALTNKENKPAEVKVKFENTVSASATVTPAAAHINLATAD